MAASNLLAGRKTERAELEDALSSGRPVAIHGRRRVGKTYLIRTVFEQQLCYELTGRQALSKRVSYLLESPNSWIKAFAMLERYLAELLTDGNRKVVFLDELPWIASPRSIFCRRSITFGILLDPGSET